jgi:CheY-like chemotaxis protein
MAQPTIVVVEPRTAQAERLIRILASLGLTDHVMICRDGREAMAHLLVPRLDPSLPAPSAILIDLDASIADGAEVARRVRDADGASSIPMVLLTETPSASLQAAAARLGASLVSATPDPNGLRRLGAALGLPDPDRAVA